MDKKRDRLSDAYSQALQTDADTVVAKTGGAAFADYAEDDLQGMPDGIEAQSFGCGNPLAFSDVQPGDTVVDLGCGAGLDLLIAAEKVGETGRVIGVDFNRDMLALAESRTRHVPTVELRHGTIEALPIATGSVDWVISNCVINLSNDKQRAFDEIARVLKPDGHMQVSDIVADALPWWVRRSGVLRAACGGGVISEAQYVAGLRAAGLQQSAVVARRHYEPSQLASIVSDVAPEIMRRLRCCGKPVLHAVLTRLALPISRNLWSARITATAPGLPPRSA